MLVPPARPSRGPRRRSKIKQLQETRAPLWRPGEKKPGRALLDKGAGRRGATKTEMMPITPGTGPSPNATDTVTVSCEGRLTDGTNLRQLHSAWRARDGAAEPSDHGWREASCESGRQEPARLPCRLGVRRPGLTPLIKPGRDARLRDRTAADLPATAPGSAAVPATPYWHYCND